MLENFPWRVFGALGPAATEGDGQAFDGRFEIGMGVFAGEQVYDLLAERVSLDMCGLPLWFSINRCGGAQAAAQKFWVGLRD